jgi:hypothetical protein
MGGGVFAALLVVALVVLGGTMLVFGDGLGFFGGAPTDLDGALADGSAAITDAGHARPRDAGPPDAGPADSGLVEDTGIDAFTEPDTGVTAPSLTRQEREDMAKDELDAARAAITAGTLDVARQHLAHARELDPESGDLEEIEALLAAQAP